MAKIHHPNYQHTELDYSELLRRSAPAKTQIQDLNSEEMVLNMGPQHPSTHGVLRLELVTDGEVVINVVPHLGYLHRCFEKHAEKLPIPQIIPYTDRLDYLSSMNNNLAFVMGAEKMMGLTGKLPKRVEYIRVLVSELNRIASHLVAIGTFGLDVGAITPFLWCFRDREHIVKLLEWASGARMLYNYIWVGGLFFDLPVGFESRCTEFVNYFKPKLKELNGLLTNNRIFVERTANVGILPRDVAINYGCSGPVLRGSGLKLDLRRLDGYSVYPELAFDICVGTGEMGTLGDCWDRYKVRVDEVTESIRIIEQCVEKLTKAYPRTDDFDPQAMCPSKTRPKAGEYYARAENPKGELGFYMIMDGKKDIPERCKVRAPSFSNLSILPEISRGVLIADLIAILGSIDIVLGEVDR
ncbi:MAG TPA: NADH-quinone oxidoreductase subunit D [Bacteroidetes bacterium]|nr:NADH-quinone oxidoreductase subunit D [Bacteroidota bacterium]